MPIGRANTMKYIHWLTTAGKKTVWKMFGTVLPTIARKTVVLRTYEKRAHEAEHFPTTFINYGYVPLCASEPRVELLQEHEDFRLSAQLYFHVAGQVDLAGREVLEVGSGRGGGCQFTRHYLKAKRIVGLDFSKSNVEFSRHTNRDPAVSFHLGDAARLPFPPESFDAVVNVESAHHYPRLDRFLLEVYRVLRKGGHLLLADIFSQSEYLAQSSGAYMRQQLQQCPLHLLKSTDITRNVIASLEARAEPLAAALRKLAKNDEEFETWANWSLLPGTKSYQGFVDRRDAYMSFLFKKD
jgi:ubiquinone/menaquinone biosynthesis C-methylase UbiE